MGTMGKLLFPISSVKILTVAFEQTSRWKIGGGFEAEICVQFGFSAEFTLSKNAKRLFFNGSVSLFFEF